MHIDIHTLFLPPLRCEVQWVSELPVAPFFDWKRSVKQWAGLASLQASNSCPHGSYWACGGQRWQVHLCGAQRLETTWDWSVDAPRFGLDPPQNLVHFFTDGSVITLTAPSRMHIWKQMKHEWHPLNLDTFHLHMAMVMAKKLGTTVEPQKIGLVFSTRILATLTNWLEHMTTWSHIATCTRSCNCCGGPSLVSIHVSASLSTQLPWKAGAGDDKDRKGWLIEG